MFALVGLVFLAIGLGLVWSSVKGRRRATAAAAWPSTRGTVVESRVDVEETYDPEDGRETSYTPVVSYAYTVGGQAYTGGRIDLATLRLQPSERKANEIAGRYPVGAEVPVYYDPERPDAAVLERVAGHGTANLVAGGVAALVGLALLLVG